MVTVKELIEKLQTVDPNLVVLTPGYEGGFQEVKFNNHVRNFKKDVNTDWYYGPHEEIIRHVESREGTQEDFQGIVL